MALFSEQEKDLIGQALSSYVQLLSQQLSEAQVGQVIPVIQNIMDKINLAEAGGHSSGGKPKGISDEHFKNVCQDCDKLSPEGGCLDKITVKFPGKCDPILMYERSKLSKKA
jgi:hypothetical protein